MSSQSGLTTISPIGAEMKDNVWQNDTPGVPLFLVKGGHLIYLTMSLCPFS